MASVIAAPALMPVQDQLRTAVPPGWAWKESLTVLAPDGDANVIFSSEPVDADWDSYRYATVQGDVLRAEFRDFRELAFEPMLMMGGREGYMRRFEWQPDQGSRVAQIQLYYAEDGRGYTATATTPSASFPAQSTTLVTILEHLRFDDTEADPGGGGAMDMAIAITDNEAQERYELRVGEEPAGEVQYQLRKGLIAFLHTGVDERFQGQGLANRLAAFVLDDARRRGLAVLPFCPLINAYIQKHPEYAALVPADQRAAFGLGEPPSTQLGG